MDNEQFTLIFNAICFFISVAGAIVSGFFCFRTLKDSWEEKKAEAEKKRAEELRNFINDLQKR